MKKIVAIFLITTLILTGPFAFLATAAENKETVDDLVLLEDWANYLLLCEECYGDVLWVLDYADAYVEEPSWDKLNIACAAVCTAEFYLSKLTLPEYSVNNETIAEYMKEGLDLLNVPFSLAESADILGDVLTDIEILKSILCSGALWEPSVLQLGKHVAVLRNCYVALLQYADCETNYILSVLDDDECYDKMLALRAEYYPEMSKYGFEYIHDTSEIENRWAEVLDRLDECSSALKEAENMDHAVEDDMIACLESGDAEAIDKRTLKLTGVKFFPIPCWDNKEQLTGTEDELDYVSMLSFLAGSECYYFYEENGERIYYNVKEEIFTAPTRCVWTNISVAKEKFISYILECAALGFRAAKIDEDENSIKAYYLFDDYDVIVAWEDGKASFFFQNSPVYFADGIALLFGK